MSIGFVSTEIIKSTDGLGYAETEVLETEETRLAKAKNAGAAGKTLSEQLADNEEKKQEEREAVPVSPTRAEAGSRFREACHV